MKNFPIIVVVMGLPGSGKTYFAKRLAQRLKAEHISSDRVRNHHQMQGLYRLSDKQQVYQWMLQQAEEVLAEGRSVVLDATFHLRRFRRLIEDWMSGQPYPQYYLEITADDATVRERTNRHRNDSEANYSVYRKLKREAEPLIQPHLQLDSSQQPIDRMLQLALEYLAHES